MSAKQEFNNRISAQRAILGVVNKKKSVAEELFSLSSKAIDRWVSENRLDPHSQLVNLVREASGKLFFLANKSQEEISEEYRLVSSEVAAICDAIAEQMR